jgi:cytochrome c
MGSRRVLAIAFAWLMGVSALAQGPTYGIGRTPTAEEIRARDISIGPTGEELPPGRGSAKEGATVYRTKGCAGCHGAGGIGGSAPILKSRTPTNPNVWARGRILPLRAPFATRSGTTSIADASLDRGTASDRVCLTAYLLASTASEDQVLDADREGEDAAGHEVALLPDWKPRTPRLGLSH